MFHSDLEVQYKKLVLMNFRVSLIINFLYPPFKWNKFKLVHEVQNKASLPLDTNLLWRNNTSQCHFLTQHQSQFYIRNTNNSKIQSSYFPITTVWWMSLKVTHLKICNLSWVTNFTHCSNNNSFYTSPLQVVAKCLEGSV